MKKDQAIALPRTKRGALYYLNRDKYLYILLFLPIAHFILFKYVPMYGVIIGFKDYNIFTGIWESDWVGFANFEEAFMRREFWQALKNTFMLNGLDILMGFWVPIVLAIILNEVRSKRWKKNVQTIIYLPHFLSWVIIGGIVTQLLKPETGIINSIIKNMGGQSVNFLTENTNWVFTYVITGRARVRGRARPLSLRDEGDEVARLARARPVPM
jgi:putative aldouronate transport system permease protein